MKREREVSCTYILGNNDTGKTVITKAIIANWLKENPKGYVAAFDPQKRFEKDIDIRTQEDLKDLPLMKNSILVFDDFRKIHKKNQPDEWLVDLMDNRAEHGLDLVFTAHSTKRMLEFLTIYADRYVTFFMNYKDKDIISKVPDCEIVLDALNIVKKEYRENGKGNYPVFPHCIVEPNNNLIIKVNFKNDPDYGKRITII